MNELTAKEESRLKVCESTIKKTLGAFYQCGHALAEIRDTKLYRTDYSSFEDYCRDRWGWEKAHVYRLIQAAEIKDDIKKRSPMGDLLQNERQIRAIADVPEENRIKVLRLAKKSGDLTAAGISKAADQIVIQDVAPKNDDIQLDETGYPIPKPAMEYWERSTEIEEVLQLISKAKMAVERLEEGDKLWYGADLQNAHIDLKNAYRNIALAMPYAVCGYCQGQTVKTCAFCGQKGLVSKYAWKQIPEEIRDIRDKTMSKKVVPAA